jgi:hypothetical protein
MCYLQKNKMRTLIMTNTFTSIIKTTGLLAVLLTVTVSCSTSPPTLGEKMINQGQSMAKVGEQWVEGETMISKGEKMIKQGEEQVEEGKQLITKGRAMMKESEETYKQRGGNL